MGLTLLLLGAGILAVQVRLRLGLRRRDAAWIALIGDCIDWRPTAD